MMWSTTVLDWLMTLVKRRKGFFLECRNKFCERIASRLTHFSIIRVCGILHPIWRLNKIKQGSTARYSSGHSQMVGYNHNRDSSLRFSSRVVDLRDPYEVRMHKIEFKDYHPIIYTLALSLQPSMAGGEFEPEHQLQGRTKEFSNDKIVFIFRIAT